VFHDINKLKLIILNTEMIAKEKLDKDLLYAHRISIGFFVFITIVYILLAIQIILTLNNIIWAISALNILFIISIGINSHYFGKTDQSTILYDETVNLLCNKFNSPSSSYTLAQLNKIYTDYQTVRNTRFSKIQIIISFISVFFISVIVSCIPKSIDFVSHRLLEQQKLNIFVAFWALIFIIGIFIISYSKPISAFFLKESDYNSMEYLYSVILLNLKED